MYARAVEPEPKQFLIAGAKNFQMAELESEVWVPVPQK